MAVILKSNNGGNKKSPVSAWLGYGAVAVFGFAIIATTLMGGGKAPDPMDSAYSYSDFKDLANMPFSSEEAESELLSSVRYGDIAKNDLINALFSEDEKDARQAEDALNGAPEAPDAEYAEAESAREKVRYAKEKYQQSKDAAKRSQYERTSKGSLAASSVVKTSSSGSGVSSTIWRSDDKKNAGGSAAGGASGALRNQLVQDMKNSGRGGGFMAAYDKSRAAAGAADPEAAHALAADAFQNAGDLEKDLKGDLEEMSEGLDLGKAMDGLDKERASNTLNEKLDKAKDDIDKKDKKKKDYKCDGSMINGKFDMGCVMSGLLEGVLDGAKQALSAALKGNKNAESAAERASVLDETKTSFDNVEKEIASLKSDEVKNAAELKKLGEQREELSRKVAYFSASDSTPKGWDKFSKKWSKKKP